MRDDSAVSQFLGRELNDVRLRASVSGHFAQIYQFNVTFEKPSIGKILKNDSQSVI